MTPIHNTFRTFLRAPDEHEGDGGARTGAPGRTPEPALQPERARKKMASWARKEMVSWRRREEWWDWGWRGRSRWLGEEGQKREGEGADFYSPLRIASSPPRLIQICSNLKKQMLVGNMPTKATQATIMATFT